MNGSPQSPATLLRADWRSGLGAIALLLAVGCGGGARPDFDVNQGEAVGVEMTSMEAARIRELFPLVGDAADSAWTYTIMAGDQLEVAFFSHPEQNRFVTVRPDGRIGMPYVGDVMAAGRAPTDLAGDLQTAYAEVLVAPRVDVIVQEMGASYFVLGQVSRPGEFKFDRRLDLLQAIARAGGYDANARLSHFVLMRTDVDGRTYAAVFDFREFVDAPDRIGSLVVRPADIIWVPRSALSRWDEGLRRSLTGLGTGTRLAIDAWTLVNFHDVYERRFTN